MILVVDDKRENILPLQKILDLHGLPSDAAESGEEALRKILKTDYSLIILDVQMPGIDGFEVAETLAGSNRTKDIPVIFLSAVNKQKRFISKGYESGGVDYITKPVDPELLILKVKTFQKLYEQKKELEAIRDLLSKEIEIRKQAQHEQQIANEGLESKVAERTRELRAKNEELELRNHELQQFSWVVSHDLKEPLRKISMLVKMMREKYLSPDEKAIDYADRTVTAAERMSSLINDLLDYSRLSSKVATEKTDLNEVLREVIADFDHLIEAKGAIVDVKLLPVITAVTSQLRQLFQNLIENALKFSQPDRQPRITISGERVAAKDFDAVADPNGAFCRITVADNGIGFDEVYLEKIFVIFQSLHDRRDYEGTGIGLAIAKKIIEKHNGLITARSRVGEGATFIILLPV
ncbi:MAG TPA: response regulator [Flavobacterium sp.]|nr:response regulator [Flavobacterium sp.]